MGLGGADGGFDDIDRVLLVSQGEDRQIDLLPDHLKLLDGRRTVDVGSHQKRPPPLLVQLQAQLAYGSRFARTLEAAEHHHRGRPGGGRKLCVRSSQERGQLFMDDFDDMLRRAETLHQLQPHGPLPDPRHEVLDHLEVHVGFQEGQTDLP